MARWHKISGWILVGAMALGLAASVGSALATDCRCCPPAASEDCAPAPAEAVARGGCCGASAAIHPNDSATKSPPPVHTGTHEAAAFERASQPSGPPAFQRADRLALATVVLRL